MQIIDAVKSQFANDISLSSSSHLFMIPHLLVSIFAGFFIFFGSVFEKMKPLSSQASLLSIRFKQKKRYPIIKFFVVRVKQNLS